ncbi:hypothetical protein F5Y17DRAFT_434932 [Xylariaceae sp. FL0594]|nr:hypothetical protein F5Y17DRAFT_434932 [Xylariaceae sp. FL0594]
MSILRLLCTSPLHVSLRLNFASFAYLIVVATRIHGMLQTSHFNNHARPCCMLSPETGSLARFYDDFPSSVELGVSEEDWRPLFGSDMDVNPPVSLILVDAAGS